jgi:uroporphyrinogen decarboxylase
MADDELTKRERVERALRGDEVDRAPISFWHHFPGRDATAEELASQTIAFQRAYDLDLIKLMPTGTYPVQDYGCSVELEPGPVGTTRLVKSAIERPEDWARLPKIDPRNGVLGEQVRCVRLVRDALGPDVPILQTVFSPLVMADKMVGAALEWHIADHEDLLRAGLERMAADVVAFGLACLEAGADGFFFATRLATPEAMPEETYRRFGVPYDLRVLDSLDDDEEAWLTVLHLHGPRPLFNLANEYSVDAVNWHDRETEPGLAEALTRTERCLAGGIDRNGAIAGPDAVAAAAEVRDAVAATGGRRLIVTPGCVVPWNAPPETLRAARLAV